MTDNVELLEAIRDTSFSILNQATIPAAEFDKEAFNKLAKGLVEDSEALTKLSSSREAKRCSEASRKLVHYTIKTIKATHAKPNGKSAKTAQLSFQKAVNKFNKSYEEIQAHVEKKTGKLKKKEAVSAETARRRVSTAKKPPVSTPLPHSSSSQSLHTPSSPLKTPREEEDVESSGEDTTNRGTQDDDDLFNQVTGDYDKIVEFNAELYIPARTAVENGNLDGFNAAVAKMPGVNMQDPNDEDNTYVGKSFWALRSRLLHWAVAYNRLDMVRTLLRRGARNLANNVGKTPLEIAKETYSGGDSSFFEVNNLLIAGLRL